MALTRPRYSTIIDTDWKTSVRAATVGVSITLSGGAPNTLDGVTLAANNRILVKDQSTASQNGIYRVSTLGTGSNGTWVRAYDANADLSVTSGQVVPVTEGTQNGGHIFLLSTPDPITLDSTNLTYVSAGFNSAGINSITNSNVSTSTTTGALTVAGGVGIGGNIYIGGNANITGDILVGGNDIRSSTGNAAITLSDKDVTIQGNLTVSGSSTILNTSTLDVTDLNITVAKGAASAAAANGAGITIDGASATLLYINSSNTWTFDRGLTVNGIANVTGNANVGNLGTAQVLATANITAPQLISNVSTGTAPLVVTSTTQIANINVATAGNLINGTSNVVVASSGNITISSAGNAAIFTVTGTGANVGGYLNVAAGTLTAAQPILSKSVTWNNSSVTFTALSTSITDTASAGGSLIADWQVGGSTKFSVNKAGNTTVAGTLNVTGNANVGNLGAGSGTITTTGSLQGGNLVVTANANVANLNYTGGVYENGNQRYPVRYTASTSPHASPTLGDWWYDTGSDKVYLRITDGTTPSWLDTTSKPPSLVAGTSNVVVTSNGNVVMGVAGNAQIFTVTGTGANVSGTLNVTANLSGGNLITAGYVSATGNITTTGGYFLGDGGLLTNISASGGTSIINGNSNVVVVSNANVTVSSAGNANVFVVTGVGANISGTLGVTGNITGNYILGNGSQLTGIITSVSNVTNGTSNVNIGSSGSNVTVSVGGTTNVAVFTTTGANITGTANVTGNILAGANIVYTGNLYQGSQLRYAPAYTASTAAHSSPSPGDYWYDTATDILYLRVTDGTTPLWFDISSQANTFSDTTTTNATITTASITTANVSGNINAANLQNGNSNVRIVANGNVTVSATGTANVVVVTSTGANISGTANITGNANVGNLGTSGLVSAGSITAANIADVTGTASALRVLSPGGASYATSSATVTGAIKIKFPTASNASNTMLRFRVTIYEYSSAATGIGTSRTFEIGGYNYSAPANSWYNCFATQLTSGGGDINVRWGGDATSQAVWIGETTTVWNYPQVFVTDFQGGYSGYTQAIWGSGWTVSFATTLDTVNIGPIVAARVFHGSANSIPAANATYTLGNTTNRFSNIWGLASSAQYADLAERYASDDGYDPGTVVIFGGNAEITVTNKDHDPRIAGVISTNPGYLMNDSADQDALMLPVALTGRVPTLVRGPIRKGDMVVSSGEEGIGIKMKKALYEPGCVIGKSLENIADDSIQTIEVVVGRL